MGAVQINEIRADEPGGTDSNEFVELKGDPGESLDGYWYLAIGDHTSFGSDDGVNIPNKAGGVVEFAIDLTGSVIGADGLFLFSTFGLQIDLFGDKFDTLDLGLTEINFENSDNVTHVLVKGYTGIEVTNFADQYDDLAVDIDDDDDGVPNAILPWTEVVDAVGLVATPNDSDPEEYAYGVALGFADVGPRGSFAPGNVYRGSDDNQWNIGNFTLINEAGDGLFEGDDFRGPALDTPGTPNPATITTPRLFTINPTQARVDQLVVLRGDNLTGATSVTVGGTEVSFTVLDDTAIQITAAEGISGIVSITTPNGTASLETPLEIVIFEGEVIFFEDFEDTEAGFGDFITVSIAGDWVWRHREYGGDWYAEMSGYSDPSGGPSEDWLITPAVDLTGSSEPILKFESARAYAPDVLDAMTVLISTDFNGVDPSVANWTTLDAVLAQPEPYYEDTDSGEIDLSAYSGETIYVAYRYVSAGSGTNDAPIFQIDNVLIADKVGVSVDVLNEDFESGLGSFAAISVASNADWETQTFEGNSYARISGFLADEASDDWLISPAVDLTGVGYPLFSFVTYRNFAGPLLEVLISDDYAGVNPGAATWRAIDAPLSPSDYIETSSGEIGLSPYIGQTVHVAFRYTTSGTGAGQTPEYQVDDVVITEGSPDPDYVGWVNDLTLGALYRYSNEWAHSPTMGFIYLTGFPWVDHSDLGYIYVLGDDISEGVWLFINGEWAYTKESWGGLFVYANGTIDSFLDSQGS